MKAPEYRVEGFVMDRVLELRSIKSPEDVVRVMPKSFGRAKREVFAVLLLNARHEVLKRVTIAVGSLNACIVHPREVFRPAVIEAAASVVLVHNHPSGDPEMSEEDISITRRLVTAGETLGIGVLDHVIIASRGVCSFRARNML